MLELGLKDKIAVITGSSDGLGLATAYRLARSGCRLAICARRDDHLQAAAIELRQHTGAEIFAYSADVSRADDIDAFIDATLAQYKGIDILVNNAGTSAAGGFETVDDEAWQKDIDLKLMAAVRFCRHVIPVMRKRGGGRIVNATIVGGKAPPPAGLPTTVTRAGGINLTKSLANEYAGDNILVNTICIGLIKSAQWQRRAGSGSVDDLYADLAKKVPLGRIGEAEEYADLVAFLVSERAAYITGTAINLDGGMSAVI